jgi:hypothetical protein
MKLCFPHDDNTYRVYVALKCQWTIMVLDAGMKKSTEGKDIPKWQKKRLETRYKKARECCAERDADLKADYDRREARRDESESPTLCGGVPDECVD